MFGLSWPEIIVIILGIVTLIKTIFDINNGVKDPNVKQDSRLQAMENGCVFKHQAIDVQIEQIKKSLILIKENELKHIEEDIRGMRENQVKIFTILEERLPHQNK